MSTFRNYFRHGKHQTAGDLAGLTFSDAPFLDEVALSQVPFTSFYDQVYSFGTKNTASHSNQSKSSQNLIWNEATMSWDDAEGTWDDPKQPWANQTKN